VFPLGLKKLDRIEKCFLMKFLFLTVGYTGFIVKLLKTKYILFNLINHSISREHLWFKLYGGQNTFEKKNQFGLMT